MPDPPAKVKRKNFLKSIDNLISIWYNNNVRYIQKGFDTMTFYIRTVFEFDKGGFKTISDYYTAQTKADAIDMAKETTDKAAGDCDGVLRIPVCGEV